MYNICRSIYMYHTNYVIFHVILKVEYVRIGHLSSSCSKQIVGKVSPE